MKERARMVKGEGGRETQHSKITDFFVKLYFDRAIDQQTSFKLNYWEL